MSDGIPDFGWVKGAEIRSRDNPYGLSPLAIHEAGHATMAILLQCKVTSMTIIADGTYNGIVYYSVPEDTRSQGPASVLQD